MIKAFFGLLYFISLLFVTGCADPNGTHHPVTQNLHGDVANGTNNSHLELPDGQVGYDRVRPIFEKHCAACHPSQNKPDWLDYAQARKYALDGSLFRRVVTEKSMPQIGSPQAALITEAERQLIGRWARGGGLERTPRSDSQPSANGSQIGGVQEPSIPVSDTTFPPARQCLQCHGLETSQALDSVSKIPHLAGFGSEYIVTQLRRFRWRDRVDPSNVMNDIAGMSTMDASLMRKIAEYFSAQTPFSQSESSPLKETEMTLFKGGEKLASSNCVQCHMNANDKNHSSDPSVPILAGQSEQYLRSQLLYFRENQRVSPLMNEYTRLLTNSDIEMLSFYFSRVRSKPEVLRSN